jgi:hypothetical protein
MFAELPTDRMMVTGLGSNSSQWDTVASAEQ